MLFEVWKDGIYAVVGRDISKLKEYLDSDAPEDDPKKPTKKKEAPWGRRQYLQKITPRYMDLVRIGISPDGLSYSYLIEGMAPKGRLVSQWISAEDAASKSKITRLARTGFPVTSGSADAVVEFLSQRAGSVTADTEIVSPSLGVLQIDDKVGWLIGTRWIGPKGLTARPEAHLLEEKTCQALKPSGALEEWLEGAWTLGFERPGPISRMLLASSFASPLLRFINVRSFFLYHYGENSGGKSASTALGVSVWGSAKGEHNNGHTFMTNFGSTAASIPVKCAGQNGLPLFLNEFQSSKEMKTNPGAVLGLIYNVIDETLKDALTPEGKLRAAKATSWRLIVRGNGEFPMISSEEINAGGSAQRVLQFEANAMSDPGALALHQWLERNPVYGVAGPHFLEWLQPIVNSPKNLLRLRGTMQDFGEAVSAGSAIRGQRNTSLAALALGAALSQCALTQQWKSLSPAKRLKAAEKFHPGAINDAIEFSKSIDKGADPNSRNDVTATITKLQSHAASNPQQWLYWKSPENQGRFNKGHFKELIGIIQPPERAIKDVNAWVIKTELAKWLKKHGAHIDRFLRDAERAGVICSREPLRRMIQGRTFHVIGFRGWPVSKDWES